MIVVLVPFYMYLMNKLGKYHLEAAGSIRVGFPLDVAIEGSHSDCYFNTH